MKVALFATCLVDGLVPDVAAATARVLERLGLQVDFPDQQTCCGQMHINSGYPRLAVPLVRNHVEAFGGYDAVVAPSGSCVAAIRHQHAVLAREAGDNRLAAQVGDLSARTYELTEFLVDALQVEDVGAWFPHRVTFHPTCHALRLLGSGCEAALRLLHHVGGLELVALPDAETCCGFGGTFALKNSDVSAAMLADKTAAIRSSTAAVCTAGDASCLLHIGGGLSRQGIGARAVHLAQILASTREQPWSSEGALV